jgi:hypothetical protein
VQGFDLGVGFLHADKPGRDSLVFDLMECARGAVDALVLDFLDRTTLRAGSFSRLGSGEVRLHPQLARAVVAVRRVSQDRVDEHAQWLRDVVLSAPDAADATVACVPYTGRDGRRSQRQRSRPTNGQAPGRAHVDATCP